MDRKRLKEAAKASVRGATGSPKFVTPIFLLCIIALVGLDYGLSYLPEHITTGGRYLSDSLSSGATSTVLAIVISLVLQLVLVLLSAGYAAVALALRAREPIYPSTLLEGFYNLGRVLLTYLLTILFQCMWSYVLALPVAVVLTFLGGENMTADQLVTISVLYAAVALLVISYRYRMAFFVVLDHPELSARQSLRMATAMTKGHRWQLFKLDLSFLPWMLLCTLTCGILLIWKLPYMVTTYAHAYDSLSQDYTQRQADFQQWMDARRSQS
jgi:uncharacterized membrane protein